MDHLRPAVARTGVCSGLVLGIAVLEVMGPG